MGEILSTERLVLRRLQPDDADVLRALAGDRAIADTTISVPHPFTPDDARRWIQAFGVTSSAGPHHYFAVCLKPAGELVGVTALRDLDVEHAQAELGFWVGRPYWGRGFATEAGRAVLAFGFGTLGLNRITAYRMVRNTASGSVLTRLGFREEGLLRQRVRKWGVFEDVVVYGLLRSDYVVGDRP